MNRRGQQPEVIFPRGADERARAEMRSRGSVSVIVRAAAGLEFEVSFATPAVMERSVSDLARRGLPCAAEPNLVIVPEVTVEAVERSVEFLWREGYVSRYLMPAAGVASLLKLAAHRWLRYRSR